MPALVVPQAGLMRLIWSLGGVPSAVGVYGVLNAGNIAITQALTNTIGTSVKSALTSSGLGAKLGTTITLANVGLRDIRSANAPEFLDSGAAVAGTGAGDLLPLQTCFVVTLRTPLAGRHFRGRTYLWGYTEGQNTAGGAAQGSAAEVAFVTALKTALTSSGLDLAIVSRPAPTAPIPFAGAVNAVTSIIARDLVWDTQRRRAIAGI